MGVINQLDISVANLIAAGEVVERPASVIKELLENSIDAGASDITVEIKNGGISFMRVTDNGCGMAPDDCAIALLRHATSKIKKQDDLDAIMTLGFRGEALAAISSVSKVRIMSRQEKSKTGTIVESEFGKILSITESGCKEGTSIIVEELFANTPARRKFLKSDRSESMAIYAVCEKIALSSPGIKIKYIQDNVQRMMTSGDGKLYNTVYALFGKEFAQRLISVNAMSDGIAVRGFIGRPDNVRANRNFENFFINRRYVKSKTASAALEQAFSSFLESEKFPVCVLFIDIHPAFVDVNVHPTKLEIKFSNEKAVFDAVYCAIQNAVRNDGARNEMYFEKDDVPQNATKTYNSFVPVYDRMDESEQSRQISVEELTPKTVDYSQRKAVDRVPFEDIQSITPQGIFENQAKSGDNNIGGKNEAAGSGENTVETGRKNSSAFNEQSGTVVNNRNDEDSEINKISTDLFHSEGTNAPEMQKNAVSAENKPLYKYLGIVFNTYIIIEAENKMLMIDKHAAHERILFESMRKNREKAEKFSVILLLPVRLSFTKEEISICESYSEDIKASGFDFECDFPASLINLTAIPGGLENDVAIELFSAIVTGLSQGTGTAAVSRQVFFEKSLYQASCKAAVKGGRDDSPEHLRYIVETLLTNPEIRYCPHGRPVMFELSQSTIEHKFKRN